MIMICMCIIIISGLILGLLLCKDLSHWLDASLESALYFIFVALNILEEITHFHIQSFSGAEVAKVVKILTPGGWCKYHGCWRQCCIRIKGTRSHNIDLVLLECSCLNTENTISNVFTFRTLNVYENPFSPIFRTRDCAFGWYDIHYVLCCELCIGGGTQTTGPRLNIKTVLSTYGDFHVKDKTAVRTSYL